MTTKIKPPIYKLNPFSLRYSKSLTKITLTKPIDIFQGDRVLICGASGVGKSTLFYLLKGLIPKIIFGKFSGEVLFLNKNIIDLNRDESAQIGLLFQNPDTQIVNLNVMSELAFGLENLSSPPDEIIKQINQYAKYFGITHLLNKKIIELSYGDKQKINLISLLLTQPKVLLLDEPTAFLDNQAINNLLSLIQDLPKQITLIIIEHNLTYFKPIINRVINISSNSELSEQDLNTITWHPSYKNYITNPISSIQSVPLLECRDYRLKNGQKLNFSLKKGEIIGITGNNGVGKSTWLAHLVKLKQYQSKIALLFQNPEHHFIHSTILDELDDQALLKTYLPNVVPTQSPFSLSEGQKRRLSLAILWSLDREIYLLDEPTFGLDQQNKIDLLEMISTMQKEGKSFIIVSHELDFLQAICNRIYDFTEKGLVDHAL